MQFRTWKYNFVLATSALQAPSTPTRAIEGMPVKLPSPPGNGAGTQNNTTQRRHGVRQFSGMFENVRTCSKITCRLKIEDWRLPPNSLPNLQSKPRLATTRTMRGNKWLGLKIWQRPRRQSSIFNLQSTQYFRTCWNMFKNPRNGS